MINTTMENNVGAATMMENSADTSAVQSEAVEQLSAKMHVTLDEAKVVLNADVDNGIVVPANAVLINNDGKFVWVAKDGRATRQNISISGYSGTGVVVSQGLHGGDLVIVEGYQKVSEGMKVECGMMNVE